MFRCPFPKLRVGLKKSCIQEHPSLTLCARQANTSFCPGLPAPRDDAEAGRPGSNPSRATKRLHEVIALLPRNIMLRTLVQNLA